MKVQAISETGIRINNAWHTFPKGNKKIAEGIEEGDDVEFGSNHPEGYKYAFLESIKLIKKADISLKSAKEIQNSQQNIQTENKDKYWQDKLEFEIKKQEIITKEALLNTATEILKKSESKYIDNNVLIEDTINIAKRLYKEMGKNW